MTRAQKHWQFNLKKYEWWDSGGYADETKWIINNLPDEPSEAYKTKINDFILSQSSAEGGNGNYELIDDIAVFKETETENNALTGWKTGDTFLKVNSPTWTQGAGLSYNGTDNYLNFDKTLDNLGIPDSLYSQDDAFLMAGIGANNIADGRYVCGHFSSGRRTAIIQRDINDSQFLCNDGAVANIFSGQSFKNESNIVMTIFRSTGSNMGAYKDKVSQGTKSTSSTTPPGSSFYDGCLNNIGTAAAFGQSERKYIVYGAWNGLDLDSLIDAMNTLVA